MHSRPSKPAETVVAFFIPPACREEVLGDLYERYRSPRQYGFDALRTIPLVIVSRMRRTADPQALVIQAFALYSSFLGAAWLTEGALPREQWGFLRLAIPAGIAMLGLILEDTYARPGRRSPLTQRRAVFSAPGLLDLSHDLEISKWRPLHFSPRNRNTSSIIRMITTISSSTNARP
jgi:hypothetical protein